jgi:hypothetical protein
MTNKPIGLEDHGREFTHLKLKHWIIKEHQRLHPILANQMKTGMNATNVYSYFLSTLPFRLYDIINKKAIEDGKLKPEFTEDLQIKLMREYRIKR